LPIISANRKKDAFPKALSNDSGRGYSNSSNSAEQAKRCPPFQVIVLTSDEEINKDSSQPQSFIIGSNHFMRNLSVPVFYAPKMAFGERDRAGELRYREAGSLSGDSQSLPDVLVHCHLLPRP
jgi:hypothetical protein